MVSTIENILIKILIYLNISKLLFLRYFLLFLQRTNEPPNTNDLEEFITQTMLKNLQY